jgi:hypothetical protein
VVENARKVRIPRYIVSGFPRIRIYASFATIADGSI